MPAADKSSSPEDTIKMESGGDGRLSQGIVVRYFGEYEILEELGVGGMGVVYKARRIKLKRIVALKMIRAGELANAEDVQRFQNEARAAAKLTHPGIVPVHEVGVHNGKHFCTMDYVLSANNSDDGMAQILVMFEELRSENKLANLKVWHANTVSLPDHFLLRADFIGNLQPNGRDFERDSQTNRLLRSHFYEIIANDTPGGFILSPFQMNEVQDWLKKNQKQKK